MPSPIDGANGAKEFFIHAVRAGGL
jgi:hypothetical protein